MSLFRKLFITAAVCLFIIFVSGCAETAPKTMNYSQLPKEINNSLGMEFVLIPAGTFQMGEVANSTDMIFGSDVPIHTVTISKPFYMSKYEVTQDQWLKVAPYNPSAMNSSGDLPVDSVLRIEVIAFANKLSSQEKIGSSGRYRLPTEAELEYAARAGTNTRFSFGDNTTDFVRNSTSTKLRYYGWFSDNSNGTSHPVGLKLPNPWGLYDMHGNVWEMTQDSWHDDYEGAPIDGGAWINKTSTELVGRGGSWLRFGRRRVA